MTAVVVDWSAVAAIGALMLALLGGLIRLIRIADGIQREVKAHHSSIDQNARHVDSIMATLWPTIWRVSSVEDYLSDEMGYRPPRLFPSMPGGPDDDRAHPDRP